MTEDAGPRRSRIARPLWLALGWLAVALAAIGAVLPLLPTTPFLLVAVWAFGKSSERWRRWVYAQPTFGPLVLAWERHGVIPIWGKAAAVGTMSVSFAYLAYSGRLAPWLLALVGLTLAAVAGFILSRPSRPPANVDPANANPPVPPPEASEVARKDMP